jgi:uncharacterized Zn finger protein
MKPKPPFPLEVLRMAAGDKVFARGEAYFKEGRVEIQRRRADQVRAEVCGGEDYITEFSFAGGELKGRCTCAAHRDFGCCKHMVAAALAANAAVASVEPAPPDPTEGIAAYLETLDRPTLKAMILDYADAHEDIARRLSLAAALSGGDAKRAAERLKREIDAATRVAGYVEYGEAADWADRVGEVADALEAALGAGAAEPVLRLAERLADRLNAALGSIDDSEGEVGAQIGRAVELRRRACEIVKPDPVRLARELFDRELDGEQGYEEATRAFAEALGPAGRAEVERLARAAWEDIPPVVRGRAHFDQTDIRRRRLREILDEMAARAGDLDARIALRSRHLASPHDYLELARFCEAEGRTAEALKWTEEALFVFEDAADERLSLFAAELLRGRGRGAEGEAALWRAFAKRPSRALYAALADAAKGAERARVTDRAVAILKAMAGKGGGLYGAADLALDLLAEERRFAEAWAYAATLSGPSDRLMRLAKASEASHPREAAAVYRRQIEALVSRGGGDYTLAKSLIDRLAKLAPGGAHTAFVADLLARHRAKRNFVKLMGGSR